MAVKIRMKRLGAKKSPFYRIVVADSRSPRNGRFIEEIGYYNPISEPVMFNCNADKAKQWIQNGAKPTETVAKLFKNYEVLEAEGVVAVGCQQTKKSFVKATKEELVQEESKETEE